VFILSDTTDPDVFIAEEAAYLTLRARLGASNIYYRHRPEERTPRRPATSPNGCAVSAAPTSR
jgi:membrane glycosyltransferase